ASQLTAFSPPPPLTPPPQGEGDQRKTLAFCLPSLLGEGPGERVSATRRNEPSMPLSGKSRAEAGVSANSRPMCRARETLLERFAAASDDEVGAKAAEA